MALGLAALTVAVVAVAGGSALATRDDELRRALLVQEPELAGCGTLEASPAARQPYALILRDERTGRRTCPTRRVFVTTPFDTPLDLQGLPYDTIVLQASAATLVDREISRRGPGATGCDYIVACAAELATHRGVPLVTRTLEPIGDAGPLRVFHVDPAPPTPVER